MSHHIGVEFRGGTVARRVVSMDLEKGGHLLVERNGDEATITVSPAPFLGAATVRVTSAERALVATALEGRPPAPAWKAADTALLMDLVTEVLQVAQGEVLTPERLDDRTRNLVGALMGQYEMWRFPPLGEG